MEKLQHAFRKSFEVHYYEVNPYQELTPLAMLNYLEEAAITHSESVGYGVNRLKAEGYGWVLKHWQIEFDRYTKLGEKVTVETWPSRFERFYADREFRVRNEDEEIIARASSLWVFLHLEKRRPLRIPKEIGEAYPVFTEKVITKPFPELHRSECLAQEPFDFRVRRSDIDTNAHVNNAKYVEWLMETVPEEVYATYRLASLDVAYKKESTYGQWIRCYTEKEGNARENSMKSLNESSAENFTGSSERFYERSDERSFQGYYHRIAAVEADEERELVLARTRWCRREEPGI